MVDEDIFIVVHEWRWSWTKVRYVPKIFSFETHESIVAHNNQSVKP